MRRRNLAPISRAGLAGMLLMLLSTACSTTTYKTEIRRGDLIQSKPTGQPEATGRVTLDVNASLRGPSLLAMDVTRLVEQHQPVRRAYHQNKVKHQVSLSPGGAVAGELANLAVTLGLGHILFWDWAVGLPTLRCLPRSNKKDDCRYKEKESPLKEPETEVAFESVASVRSRADIEGTQITLTLTSMGRGERKPIQWSRRVGAKGVLGFDLAKVVPQDESRMLLEVAATRDEVEDDTFGAVVARNGRGFTLDANPVVVARARKDVEAAKKAWSIELTRREAAREEAARKADEQERLKQEKARKRKLAKLCPGGVYGYVDLTRANPYDVKGKCFEFIGNNLQTFSRSRALYNSQWNDTYYLDFSKESAPRGFFHGYTKGVGVFEYETVTGAQKVVPSLLVVRLPEPVPASPR